MCLALSIMRLGDIFGRRRVFLIGVVSFGASSVFTGRGQTAAWLIGGRRTGHRLGPDAGHLSIVTSAPPPRERDQAIGTRAAVSALALAIGPIAGRLLVEHSRGSRSSFSTRRGRR
jgi:MFS family permease